jgi:hypothetical protein
MRYRSRSSIWVGVLCAGAWAVLTTTTQAATCGPNPIKADVVFVGTLTGADDKGGRATFAVEDVWTGDVPAVVEVTGSPGQWSGQPGATRYLVIASVVGGSLQVGGDCLGYAAPWDPSMAAERPSGAHPPGSLSTGDGVPIPLLLMAGVVAVLVVVSLVAFRQRRTPVG